MTICLERGWTVVSFKMIWGNSTKNNEFEILTKGASITSDTMKLHIYNMTTSSLNYHKLLSVDQF